MATTDPIRSKKDIKTLADYYLHRGELRNYLLIVMGIYTALRISDLLQLTWDDVYDFDAQSMRSAFSIREKKTGKLKLVPLNKHVLRALSRLAVQAARPQRFLFESRKTKRAIGRTQAYRIIKKATEALRLAGCISCHSLRKTFGYYAFKAGVSVAVIMDIYNHSSYAVTKRYLGISQDDRNQVYLSLSLLQ